MKKLVVLLLISLLLPIKSLSQSISKDSVLILNPEQVKTINLIFAEHEKFSKDIPLLKTEISTLQSANQNLTKIDSLRVQEINQYKNNIKQLKKSIKTKNMLNAGLGTGFLLSLLILIIK